MDENINILTFSYKINNLNVFRIFNPLKFANVSYAEYKFFCTNSIMLKRTLFDQFMFDEKLHFGEDIKLWSQILSQFNFTHINIPITKYNFDYKGYGNNYEKFKFHKMFQIIITSNFVIMIISKYYNC
jgi:hypothetical protein